MITVLLLILVAAISWTAGHRTARIQIINVGATADNDNAALLAHERARFNDLIAQVDLPDDLRNPE